MQETLVSIHSMWRWVVLLMLIITLVRSVIGWLRGDDWDKNARLLATLTVSAIDIQVLGGLLVYGVGKHWTGSENFIAYIHPLVMILALVVAHVVNTMVKRQPTDVAKYRLLAIGLLIVFLMVGGAIPTASWRHFA